MRAVALLVMLVLIMAQPVAAHSPRVGTGQPLGDTGLQLALWYGDGIVGPDPIRAVVLDDQGRLHAVSPWSNLLRIECDGAGACLVRDRLARQTYIPDPLAFTQGTTLIEGQAVLHYPEFAEAEFGFTTVPTGWGTYLLTELRALIRHPLLLLAAALWWAMIWLIFAGGWRFARQPDESRWLRWLIAVLAAIGGGVLLLVSAFVTLLLPTTPLVLGAVMAMGAGLAWAIRRIKRRWTAPVTRAA